MTMRGVWLQVWQWGQPTAAEETLDDAIALCRQFGLAGLGVKAFDGDVWMGDIREQLGAPDALRSVDQVADQRARCEAAGLGYAIWVNPLHGSYSFLEREAGLYAAAARAAGQIWWDTEPYQDFWGANRPWEDIRLLLERFRDQAPAVTNVWQPDGRPARLAELRPQAWAPFMQVYAPQVYWSTFERPWLDVLQEAFYPPPDDRLEWVPTLPGEADPGEIHDALVWAREQTVQGCIVWRMGSAGPGQLAVLRDTPLHAEPPAPPEPVDSCEQLRATLQARHNARPYRPIRKKELAEMLR